MNIASSSTGFGVSFKFFHCHNLFNSILTSSPFLSYDDFQCFTTLLLCFIASFPSLYLTSVSGVTIVAQFLLLVFFVSVWFIFLHFLFFILLLFCDSCIASSLGSLLLCFNDFLPLPALSLRFHWRLLRRPVSPYRCRLLASVFMWLGKKKENLSHIHIWGCVCVGLIDQRQPNTGVDY